MTRHLALNDLETKRFGVVCARLNGLADLLPDLWEVNAEARDLGVEMVSTRVDCRALDRVQELEGDGYRLMDSLVYYERPLVNVPPALRASEGGAVRWADTRDAVKIGQIARAAFQNYIGHYHADPRLRKSAANEAYAEWATSCVGAADTQLLVVEEAQALRGFLALRRNTAGEFEIVLNAVAPEARRRGHYRLLLSHALTAAHSQGAEQIVTSTQIGNFPVQREWARQGFLISGAVFTLHKWFTPSDGQLEA